MSRISDISHQYKIALETSQGQYEDICRERAQATEEFYRTFFHRLVCNYGERFLDERYRARLQERIGRTLGTNRLQFTAIDGTCRKEQFSDFITFFGGAYGARGEVALTGGSHQINYRRWTLEQDVSMVAWVPVPFARLEEVTPGQGEQFLVTEEERVNLSSVHVQVMQLAEIFLAYNSVRSSRLDAPHVLMMDLSPSSVLASVATSQENIGLVGYPYDRRALTKADITIALAHPLSPQLGIPSPKNMDLHRLFIDRLHHHPNQPVNLGELASEVGVSSDKLSHAADFLIRRGVVKPPTIATQGYQPIVDVTESWAYVRDFFQNVCTRLFLKKDPGALQYDAPDESGRIRRRWMSPDDIGFLIAVGMRLLIEECWERGVLLYGVVKDSSSRYLTRNFLGVALETGFHPELAKLDVGVLPWTDRLFCEHLPDLDESLLAPWSTVEFDSAFMTLHRERIADGEETRVAGVMGRIVNQERLFAKSLAQFYLKRGKRLPLMGHVVFLERLVSPAWDRIGSPDGPAELLIDTPEIGRVLPLAWRDNQQVNTGQAVMMYILSVLTRNHFAEAIGYPDPLHKADWGAKTIGRFVGETIKSSAQFVLNRPLSRTFRDTRDRHGR